MAKFILPDNSPKNKRRLAAASGAYYQEGPSNNSKRKYANSTTVSVPITRNAQYAGSGANVVWTQPMFFSPLHTPQNWQIASRRREIMQWSFISSEEKPCYLTLNDDFSLIKIQDIVENKNNRLNVYIQNGFAKKSIIDKTTKRYVSKKANKIKILGLPEGLNVTNDHDCIIIKKENVKCRRSSNHKKCIVNNFSSTCKRYQCKECINREYEVSKVKAKDIRKGDYVLIPFNSNIKESIIKTISQARFAGHLASDGSIIHKYKSTQLFMNSEEENYVYPYIEKTFQDYSVSCAVKEKTSKKLITVRSSKKELYDFSSRLVRGKGSTKKFTKEVVFLDPKLQKHVLGAYIQSDGSYNKSNKNIEITTYSSHLANQLLMMFFRCGILARSNKQKISSSSGTYKSSNIYRYIVSISSSESSKIRDYIPGKLSKEEQLKIKRNNHRFFYKNYVVAPVVFNEEYDYEGYVYDVREPETNTIVANGISIYQCRFYYCFTPDNYVLMADGTEKRIDEIQVGDFIIDGHGSKRRVEKVNARYTEEDIIKIRVGGINREIKVTLNHSIPRVSLENWVQSPLTTPSERRKRERLKQYGDVVLNRNWDTAESLEIGDRLITPKTKIGTGFRINDFDENMCYLLGLFGAEGSYYWYNYKKEKEYPKGIRFSINVNEYDMFGNKIKSIFENTGINVCVYNNFSSECIDIVLHNVGLAKKIYEIIGEGSKTKYINPEFIDNANESQLLSFLSGYIDGDGCYDSHHGCQIRTASDILSSQLSTILEKLNISFSIFKEKPQIQNLPNNKKSLSPIYSYNIRICRRDCEIFQGYSLKYKKLDSHHMKFREYLSLSDGLYRSVINLDTELYRGNVYDLTIEGEHSYCINRCVVHNSNEAKVAAGVDFYCFDPNMQVLMANGTQKDICSIREGDAIRSHDGSVNFVEKVHKRNTDEEMLEVVAEGLSFNPLKITKGHEVLTDKEGKIQFIEIENLEEGDYLLSPTNYDGDDKETSYSYNKIINISSYKYVGDVYDLTISNKSSYIVNGIAVHNSNFSMNGFKLECKSRKILKYFERLVDKLDLPEKCNSISHEYFLIGDVFPFLEIDCPSCGGSGRNKKGELCNHPDGTFKSIKLMNPDYVEVRDNPIASKPEYYLLPDEELRLIVQRREPKSIYNKLPQALVDLVSSGQHVPLSDRCISHLKHNASDYGTYGTSMLQRLFTILAYKTKIMTANWIVAERLILPVRVVKVGDKDRPATDAELQDVQNQLAAVANDPNLAIITHHAFELEWVGATGKIHNITQELEQVGKEILDGLMLNQAILNGEMCIPETDLTLTKEGFKHLDDITENDYIGTFNIEKGNIEYQKYDAKHIYNFDGDLCQFRTERIDFVCTPNHKMLFQKRDHNEWIVDEAINVKDRVKFRKQVGWKGKDYDSIIVGDSEIDIDVYIRLVAYYVTEGYLHKWTREKNKEKVIRGVAICQSKKGKAYDDICFLMDELSSICKCSYRSNEFVFVLNNKDIANHLLAECGQYSENKRIPQWIKELPPKRLRLLLMSMIDGDGSIRTRDRGQEKQYYTYYTKNRYLAYDVMEVALKCGYWPKVRSRRNIYEVNFSDYDLNRETITLESKRFKTVDVFPYKGRVYCFTVPNHYIITMRNGKLMISHNSGYTSAQVGVEVLIRRLENWRNKLKEWIEKHIFLPVAQMQGFIDEEESKIAGETIYLYPKLIWNDLQLRDKTNRIQTLIQCYDKGLISAQTILEELDLDYDSEVQKIREEQIMASASGLVGGPQAGNLGTMGMGAALGGAGGGGMPPDIAGEGLAGGGAPGGMPGAPGGMPGGSGMGGVGGEAGGMPGGTAASSMLPKIGKRGSKKAEEQFAAPPPVPIKLTSLEQKMFKVLSSLKEPYDLYAQYEVRVPGEQRPYSIDFAYPKIGVGVECDGAVWHQRPDFQQRDLNRDKNLANIGWRILRFNEEAISEHIDLVKDTIAKHIKNAAKEKKAAQEHGKIIKTSSSNEGEENSQYNYCLEHGEIGCYRESIPYGQILYIGNVENG